jgi:hypothetical protein
MDRTGRRACEIVHGGIERAGPDQNQLISLAGVGTAGFDLHAPGQAIRQIQLDDVRTAARVENKVTAEFGQRNRDGIAAIGRARSCVQDVRRFNDEICSNDTDGDLVVRSHRGGVVHDEVIADDVDLYHVVLNCVIRARSCFAFVSCQVFRNAGVQ